MLDYSPFVIEKYYREIRQLNKQLGEHNRVGKYGSYMGKTMFVYDGVLQKSIS